MNQKILPYLWFDKEAKEAAEFYVDAFGNNSKLNYVYTLDNSPSENGDVVSFELLGSQFMSFSAGPLFKFTPSISFFVNFDPSRDDNAKDSLTKLWEKLSAGGSVLMDLGEYPFSKYYGWIQDKYGVSWQLILTDPEGEPRPDIIPSLLFTGDNCGKAAEAIDFYVSVFKNSKKGLVSPYAAGQAQNPKAKTAFGEFMAEGQWITVMDSGVEQDFSFSEAISLMINCETQAEIDYYWEKLSAVPEAEQCGWLKDKYGVSWQVAPFALEDMLRKGTPEQAKRVTEAFLQMKKFDLEALRQAYNA